MNIDFYGLTKHIEYLKNVFIQNRLHSSYIFSGPSGLGKKEMAEYFLKMIECLNPVNGEPCGNCNNCHKIEKNIFVDYLYIEPEKDKTGKLKTRISIDQVKENIMPFSLYSPNEGKYKLCVINPAEKMNQESANALLKILEEPPKNFIFILITENYNMLLPTILSRCQILNFKLLTSDIIKKKLITYTGIDEHNASIFAGFANGRIKKAHEMSSSGEILEKRKFVIENLCDALEKKSFTANFEFSFKLGKYADKEKTSDKYGFIEILLEIIIHFFRDVLIRMNCNKNKFLINNDYKNEIEKISEKYSVEEILRLIYNCLESFSMIKRNTRALLIFNNIFV